MKFYADGQEIGNTTKAGGAIDTGGEAPAYIGSYIGTGEFFKGGIDDVRLYNRALSADEINTMALGDGKETVDAIVGWWKLERRFSQQLRHGTKGVDCPVSWHRPKVGGGRPSALPGRGSISVPLVKRRFASRFGRSILNRSFLTRLL